jgi:hypothetical protein
MSNWRSNYKLCYTVTKLSGRVIKGVLRDHLWMPDTMLAARVFSESTGAKPLTGLVVAA